MSEFSGPATADALAAVYGNMTAVADGLGEAELMLPTRCAGWVTGDLLYHQLLDARRALRTFASPVGGPADTDDVSYWRKYSPRGGEHEALGSAESAAHARHAGRRGPRGIRGTRRSVPAVRVAIPGAAVGGHNGRPITAMRPRSERGHDRTSDIESIRPRDGVG
jgi:hypothetical protein